MAASRDARPYDFDDLISVKEAAKILHVSESTVWRWIDRDILKAYRIGPKRICLRRAELTPAIRQLRKDERDLRKYFLPEAPGPKFSTEEVLRRARALSAELLAKRGGVLFPESWIDINEMRDERSEQL
jgi:excisionase family DNA binding protein